MITYSHDDISRGIGEFDRAMRTQTVFPGYSSGMAPGVAVGVVLSAMKSGMPARLIDKLPEVVFPADAQLLTRVLQLCEGDNWNHNLWNRLNSGKYKLCTALCGGPKPGWRYDASQETDDL